TSESEIKPIEEDTKIDAPSSQIDTDNGLATDNDSEVGVQKGLGSKEESAKDLTEGQDKIEISNEVKSDIESASTIEERSDGTNTASVTKDEIPESEIKPNENDTEYVDPSSQVIQDNSMGPETEIDADERKELGNRKECPIDLNEDEIETSKEVKSDGESASSEEERSDLIDIASATKDETSASEIKTY
ncbi:hypothetical protein AVEN_216023-1, partial [Araneus ventricosus]